mmetsp:Transcript_75178/g.195931  ORF Transcript_75178/g.195931 Transcript_75178/m.195931 type:complete len:423 (+) Transcript_75178:2-1270(+)
MDRGKQGKGYPAGRRQKQRDPDNPKDAQYLRAMHPDFDEIMGESTVAYKSLCQTDAQFGSKFAIPPVVDPVRSFQEHSNSVDAVCWGPDHGTFVSASHDRTLKVWDAASGRCLKTLAGHDEGVYHCEAVHGGRVLLSCGAGESRNALVWSWPQAAVSMELKGHHTSVYHVASSGDGARAATAGKDGTVLVHDLATGSCTFGFSCHTGRAHASSFCKQEPSLLASCGHDGRVRLLDLREAPGALAALWRSPSRVANSTQLATALDVAAAHDGEAVYALHLQDAHLLYTAGADCKLKRWDTRALGATKQECAGEYLGHTAPLRALTVAEDGRFVVTACEDGSCRLWHSDPAAELEAKRRAPEAKAGLPRPRRGGHGEASLALVGHSGLVSACAWRGEAGQNTVSVLSGSWDQTVKLFTVDLAKL